MSIPKEIHYCWFGYGEKSELVKKCIESWMKYCPDCKIIEWNESNYDVTKNLYMYQAYQAKRWGFVSDVARLDIIYENGGIYFDTDVELIKSIDPLWETNGFLGFEKDTGNRENKYCVNTGQGMGARAKDPIIRALLNEYKDIPFYKENGTQNLQPCPYYNTKALVRAGLRTENVKQRIGELVVYPSEYFCPVDWKTHKCIITENTYSIHHFDASWLTPEEKRQRQISRQVDFLIHMPNVLLKNVLGSYRYEKMKKKLKK